MLTDKLATNILAAAVERGADFADIFVEQSVSSSINFLDSKVKNIKTGTDFGVGVRLVFGHESYYGYTNLPSEPELLKIVEVLSSRHRKGQRNTLVFDSFKSVKPGLTFSASKGLNNKSVIDDKIAFLSDINSRIRKYDKVTQVDASVVEKWQQVQIFNTEGLKAEDERFYTRLPTTVIAQDGAEQVRSFAGPGGFMGWEYQSSFDSEQHCELLAKRALTMLKAEACPAGKMPVVLDNAFGGVIFHEACGHLLETTSVEKKASVFHDKMGEMIASEVVSAVDDGTIDGKWGSIAIDDEGTPTQKTQLIKNGKLESFLVDKLGSLKTGYKTTGSGRRQSYKFPPASRMRNTFIEAGQSKFDDLITSIDKGIYAKSMGGGSVSPGTGDFNFAIEEAYLIEGGKITRPVKGATLIGSGPDTLKQISMVSDNLELAPGMCGSVSGSVPVTVGQPALKVDEILVGGKA